MLISSVPMSNDVIVDGEGRPTRMFAEYLTDLFESNNQDNPKNNYVAAAGPVVTNNRSEGYTVGSEWIDAPTVYTLTSFTGTDANWTALN